MGEDVIGAFGTGNMTAGGTERRDVTSCRVFLYVLKFGNTIDKLKIISINAVKFKKQQYS